MKSLVVVALLAQTAWADSQAVSYGDGGIQVGGTVVYPRKVTRAAFDPAQDLIWFTTDGKLEVIDLREAGPRARVIATGVKNEYGFAIQGASTAASTDQMEHSYVILTVGKKVKVTRGAPNWSPPEAGPGDDDYVKAVKKTKIVGKKWLASLAKRSANPAPAGAAPSFPTQEGWNYVGWSQTAPNGAAYDQEAVDALGPIAKAACACKKSRSCKDKATNRRSAWSTQFPDALSSGAQAQDAAALDDKLNACLK